LLPEAGAAFDGCECVYRDQNDYSLHRSGDQAECEGLRVVFIPSLYVECEKSCGALEELTEKAEPGIHANNVMTVFQPIPKFCDAAKIRHSSEVFTASTP